MTDDLLALEAGRSEVVAHPGAAVIGVRESEFRLIGAEQRRRLGPFDQAARQVLCRCRARGSCAAAEDRLLPRSQAGQRRPGHQGARATRSPPSSRQLVLQPHRPDPRAATRSTRSVRATEPDRGHLSSVRSRRPSMPPPWPGPWQITRRLGWVSRSSPRPEMDRAFAGILELAPDGERSRDRARVREALRGEPAVNDATLGPLTLAFSGGRPRRAESGVVCLLDGHIHELGALRGELGIREDDPEAVLAAGYARWGEDLLARLRGTFVVALWDPRTGRGILARDQLGARSLFLHEAGARLLLASELRDLLRLIPSRPGPDRLAVLDWLARSRVRAGRTLYEGVRPLRPAHFLRLERGSEGLSATGRLATCHEGPCRGPRRSKSCDPQFTRATARHFASDGTQASCSAAGSTPRASPPCRFRSASPRAPPCGPTRPSSRTSTPPTSRR